MPDKYIVGGDHAASLASGGRVTPGDSLPASAVDLKDPNDRHLIADGVLIDTAAKEKSQ